jgi:hypothetical protein
MNDPILQVFVPAIGLVSGLIATYVTLKNQALLAEVRQELAELENRLIAKMNGMYVRTEECKLRTELTQEKINTLAAGMHKAEPPPDC